MLTLFFFHGRVRSDEKMEGWGFDGPTLLGVEWFAVTYMATFRVGFVDEQHTRLAREITGWADGDDDNVLEMPIVDDCVHLPGHRWTEPNERGAMVSGVGAYFGDWSVDADQRTLERMSTGERVEHIRRLGAQLRAYAPEAADYLESYEEMRRNPRRR